MDEVIEIWKTVKSLLVKKGEIEDGRDWWESDYYSGHFTWPNKVTSGADH